MTVGFTVAGLTVGTYWSIAGISLGVVGLYASNAHLWPLPSMFLTGAAAASGIAWANSLGILAGGITPPAIGWIKDATGSFGGGLYLLAAWGLMGAVIAALCVRETAAKLAPEDALEAAE
jgi:ACS family tartrate transporter-like MFS transporter